MRKQNFLLELTKLIVGSIPVYGHLTTPFSKEFNFDNADNSPCLHLIWTLSRVSEIV